MFKLQDYKPDWYNGVLEMDALLNAEQPAFDKFDDGAYRLLLNHFVMRADSDGLSVFEFELGITTDLSRSLESRRYDILMRLLPPHPITFKYLKELIQSFQIPAEVQRDVLEETLTTVSQRSEISDDQVERLRYLLNVYSPANMVLTIQLHSQADSNLHSYVGVGSFCKSVTAVLPRMQDLSEVQLPLFTGVAKQIYVKTSVNAKEGGI